PPGRGPTGQNARSGGGVRPGFEGGQMPLYRRIAHRGFSNYPFKKEYKVVNLKEINEKFFENETVSLETLRAKGLIKSRDGLIKILGNGELDKKLVFKIEKISAGASEKIRKVGGILESCVKKSESDTAK
ncbi:MAG: 50S ribosomal protein L15, partial [Spirochaetota bacterium]